jgi:hypothetical protein
VCSPSRSVHQQSSSSYFEESNLHNQKGYSRQHPQ